MTLFSYEIKFVLNYHIQFSYDPKNGKKLLSKMARNYSQKCDPKSQNRVSLWDFLIEVYV